MKNAILKLLFIISFVFEWSVYAQTEMTEEKFYLWSLKRSNAKYPGSYAQIMTNGARGFADYWDKSNYRNSKSNELSKIDYEEKMVKLLESKIQKLNYQTAYYYVAEDKLLDYNFDDESFTTSGTKLFSYKHFSNISYSSSNNNNIKFIAIKFFISKDKAKKLLESKTSLGQTNRIVYKKVYFKVLDYEMYGSITIEISKIELYGDQYLTNKLFETTLEVKNVSVDTGTAMTAYVPSDKNTITDIDGNIYHTVTIGKQVWMVENLKTAHYRNGEAIPNVLDNKEWVSLTKGAYCDYNNDTRITEYYGRLYNSYAVHDTRGIALKGWHIPTDSEWLTLVEFLGGLTKAGGDLKATGTADWNPSNSGATNSVGFTALPGGRRYQVEAMFSGVGRGAFFWSSSQKSCCILSSISTDFKWFQSNVFSEYDGFSVRCLKD